MGFKLDFLAWLARFPGLLARLVRDLASEAAPTLTDGDAQVDDVLDAARDDDGMEATGL
jgi:hypothetical protein